MTNTQNIHRGKKNYMNDPMYMLMNKQWKELTYTHNTDHVYMWDTPNCTAHTKYLFAINTILHEWQSSATHIFTCTRLLNSDAVEWMIFVCFSLSQRKFPPRYRWSLTKLTIDRKKIQAICFLHLLPEHYLHANFDISAWKFHLSFSCFVD